MVLLGKRSAGGAAAGDDAGEETPASRRSVRQRMDGGEGVRTWWMMCVCCGAGAGVAAGVVVEVHRLQLH